MYKARLRRTGEEVAIKVQRPGVAEVSMYLSIYLSMHMYIDTYIPYPIKVQRPGVAEVIAAMTRLECLR